MAVLEVKTTHTSGEFDKKLYEFLKNEEKVKLTTYDDGFGNLTIGVGYNLSGNKEWRNDFKNAGIEVSPKATIENLKITEEEAKKLFDATIDRYKDKVKKTIGEEAYNKLENSDEMVALVSMAFNSRKKNFLIGPNLTKAILENDRIAAWYEIRYASNKDRIHGIQQRRTRESNTFGLFKDPKNITTEEAIKAIRFLESKRTDIEKYLAECYDGKANPNQKHAYNKNDLSEQLKPAMRLLATKYLKGELKFDEKDKDIKDIIKNHLKENQGSITPPQKQNSKKKDIQNQVLESDNGMKLPSIGILLNLRKLPKEDLLAELRRLEMLPNKNDFTYAAMARIQSELGAFEPTEEQSIDLDTGMNV